MATPEQKHAAEALPRIRRIANNYSQALNPPGRLMAEGALVGPAGDRLSQDLVNSYRTMRSAIYTAFDQVRHMAGPEGVGTTEPYLGSVPQPTQCLAANVRSGEPSLLDQLISELNQAGHGWENAGQELTNVLGSLGLNTSPGHNLRRAGTWLANQGSDLQRRRLLLMATTPVMNAPQAPAPHEKSGAAGLLDKGFDLWAHHYLPGLGESLKDLGMFAAANNPYTAIPYALNDFDGWLQQTPIGMLKAVPTIVKDPEGFAKAIVNWDMWVHDPARAFGEAVPNLAITIATWGVGGGAGALSRIRLAATKLGKVKPIKAAETVAKAADRAETPHLPHDDVRESHSGAHDGDPVARKLTWRESAQLRVIQREADRLGKRFGVTVDLRSFPVDPGNAAAFVKALSRVAEEYPAVLRSMQNVKVLSLAEMRRIDPTASSKRVAFAITNDRGPWPRGLYFTQERFGDMAATDALAAQRHGAGWSSHARAMTAEGTFYHEFGHQIGDLILANPALRRQLADELTAIGLSVDRDSLIVSVASVPPPKLSVRSGLGRYGSTNTREMISEAFAEWKLSSHPRPIASVIGKFIDDLYKGK